MSQGKWALYVPTLFFAAAVSFASAQCSQAFQPEAPPSAPPTGRTMGDLPAAAEAGSSSVDTPTALRFGNGTAVTVLEETQLQVMNDLPVSSRTTKAGDRIPFTVTRDVVGRWGSGHSLWGHRIWNRGLS